MSEEPRYYTPIKKLKPEPVTANISRVMRADDTQLAVQLDPLSEDVDPELLETFVPELPNSLNLAAYVNRSPTLQRLVDLGVDLSVVEKDYEATNMLMSMDFDRNMKSHIQTLVDVGVRPEDVGQFITRNPYIFSVSIHNIRARVEYLLSKRFPRSGVRLILTNYPNFLSISVKQVDARLGFLQKEFGLSPNELRSILIHQPEIMQPEDPIIFRVVKVAINDLMGFDKDQMRQLIVAAPAILCRDHQELVNVFDILHNTGDVSHEIIVKFPEVLLIEERQLQDRIQYLKLLGRAQFDPTIPLFVPLTALSATSDEVFACKYARTSEADYNLFLRDR